MRASRFITFAAMLFAVLGSSPASAGWINELGRDLGVGWSDGYHAYEGCPDPRLRTQPWQRRSNRGYSMEPLVPYLEPAAPVPENLPTPKPLRTVSAPKSQLRISRPNY